MNFTLTRRVSRSEFVACDDVSARREVRTRNDLHHLVKGNLRIVEVSDDAVYDFGKVMRRYIRRKTYRYTRRTVYEKVRKSSGESVGFFERVVEVKRPVYGIFVYTVKKFERERLKFDFGVPHRRRAVAVDRAEVAVSVDKRHTHVERLGKSDHSVVNRSISVGVIFCETVADHPRRFFIAFIGKHSLFEHRIKDTPLNGFKTVFDPRKGSVENDVFGIRNHRVVVIILFLSSISFYPLIRLLCR